MHKVGCPNCGSTVTFRAGETVFAVCSYCQTAIVRTDISVESIGKVAILQDAWSPLQIGTEGDFDGGHFFTVGRVTYGWEDGNWSEWYLSFNDGRYGWMTEAQGFYALSLPAPLPANFPEPTSLKVGDLVDINSRKMSVSDIKPVELLSSAGELPFRALPGRRSTTFDFVSSPSSRHIHDDSHHAGQFASLEISDEGVSLFVGRYCEFDTLHFSNLRQIDGW